MGLVNGNVLLKNPRLPELAPVAAVALDINPDSPNIASSIVKSFGQRGT